MSKKERKIYVMTEESLNYLSEYMEKTGLNKSQAINAILLEHKNNSNLTTEYLINLIVEKITENIKISLLPLRKAVNTSDKNSKIILELLNGKFIKDEVGLIFSTEEKKSPALEKAERVINERIVSQRTSKLDKEY